MADDASQAKGDIDDALLDIFITGSHILHHHGIVDGYGHLSVRNPHNPSTFFMARHIAPALISSEADLVQYNVEDASPVYPNVKPGYAERCIHSELLKKYPDVNAVVHSHCPEVLPYCVSNVPLRPTTHMAGFLGPQVPVWDIAAYMYSSSSSSEPHDLLVRTPRLGAGLANAFGKSRTILATLSTSLSARIAGHEPPPAPRVPEHSTVLMRGHGFTTAAFSIETAVFQAVYTKEAAQALTGALTIAAAWGGGVVEGGKVDEGSGKLSGAIVKSAAVDGVRYLSDREARDAGESIAKGSVGRPWELWRREVDVCPLYRNEVREKVCSGMDELTGG
ncbi:class II aldolase and Adducin N-terminal domain-containing protein [Phyllosticta citrichinensis]|uniref:Class II aldolase and Adducin N-terminal domain-containing protein n=1 Tax=Phyllosticta citrichinensis TaxID=1130410 RepID=A0ABR1Y3G8_9PEZI